MTTVTTEVTETTGITGITEITRLPRWCAHPGDGFGEVVSGLPEAAGRAAQTLGVGLSSVLFTAYVRVIAALTVESEVVVGYRAGGPLRSLRIALDGLTWRELVQSVDKALADGSGAAEVPGAEPDTVFETVFETVSGFEDGAALAVRSVGDALHVRFRRSEFDAEHAGRIAGYLVRVLEAVDADPEAEHADVELLSAAERDHQLNGMNGPVFELPDARFHELFSARAAEHPDRTAVVCRDEQWSYGRLDRASNRIAHALLADGLEHGGVVALAAERGLPWAAAVIGIFKAGGVFLPIEPDWPAARVTGLIGHSGARHVLTEPGGHAAGADRPDAAWLVAADIVDDLRYPDGAPGVRVAERDVAYIYFTSGSTGSPKGATCEHLGLLNHLHAKVRDLRITAGDTVLQSAQASFDISLWQLVAGLLVGARTVILPRQQTLDVQRFIELITERDVTVAQVVPSYLDVLLDHLARHPGGLGRLREVSVTGEAITKALIARWFERLPDIRLINAFGATEVSDDTTHEIFTEPPPDDIVPVGLANINVLVSVLGPDDKLVPLGSPGEIAFSGVMVGRGYVNDPVRTAEVFVEDPLRPGVAMYRTGDFGRWLPGGKLGFHGRRDEQVKIRGIRIELGEVESRLLEHPAVRAGSVVTVPVPGAGRELAAFYTSPDGPTADELRAYLLEVLPAGYVPARLYELGALPLTANGKVDKKSLIRRALDELPRQAAAADRPATPTEARIAEAWAAALDVPVDRIGRKDRFFALGGTSLGALRMVAALEALVRLDQVIADPELGELAAAADARPGGGS